MFTRLGKQARRAFNVLFALVVLTGAVGITPSLVQAAQADSAPGLLQFTSGGYALGFTSRGMYALNGTHALHVDFARANPVKPQADSAAGAEGKPARLGRVSYVDLWEGVTLTYRATASSIYTTTYSLAPGANPAGIRLRYNAPLSLNEDGSLHISFESSTLTESAPVAWQEIHGERMPVKATFRVDGQALTFALGAYDPGYALTIDPSLVWNTFLGGSEWGTIAAGVAVDGSGNTYVAGYSMGTWGNPVRPYTYNTDAFAAKLDSSGNLIWNTFLGGDMGDLGTSIALDGGGNVYVAGSSNGGWGSPLQAYLCGPQCAEAFVAKLDTSGNLTWNTFLGGGSAGVMGTSTAVDGSGNIYVTGSSDATWGSPVRPYTNSNDVFIAKLDPSGNLTWNTFLGGSGYEYPGYGIAVDGSGNTYVAARSNATWGSPLRAFVGGSWDAFAAKLDSSGALTWNTFLGESGEDDGNGIAVDGSGNVYVAGGSASTWGSPVRAYTSGADAFAARLDPSGNLTWNTFLGGSGGDDGFGIAADGSGNVYLSGTSSATWGSPARAFTGGPFDSPDAFAAKLDSSGNLTWNTFLGGSGEDGGLGIAADGSGNIYMVGQSTATWGTPVNLYGSSFVAKISPASWTVSVSTVGRLISTDPQETALLPLRILANAAEGNPFKGAVVTMENGSVLLGTTDDHGILTTGLPLPSAACPGAFSSRISAEKDGKLAYSDILVLYTADLIGVSSALLEPEEVANYNSQLLYNYATRPGLPCPNALCRIFTLFDLLAKVLVDDQTYSPQVGDRLDVSLCAFSATGATTAYRYSESASRDGAMIYSRVRWTESYQDVQPLVSHQMITRNTLVMRIGSPATGLMVDPSGKRAGFDPLLSTLVFDTPVAISDVGDEPYILVIPEPMTGEYTFEVTGTAADEYTVDILSIGSQGDFTVYLHESVPTLPGLTNTYQVEYAQHSVFIPLVCRSP